MRLKLLIAVGLILCVAATGTRAQQPQFTVYASIVDTAGKPVASLEPTDVRILEAGAEAKVVKVEPVNWPVKV